METRSPVGVKRSVVSAKNQKKFSLTDKQAERLAMYARAIEKHYRRPMDIEWAIDKDIYIIQARPETIHSQKDPNTYIEYRLLQKSRSLVKGAAVGRKI